MTPEKKCQCLIYNRYQDLTTCGRITRLKMRTHYSGSQYLCGNHANYLLWEAWNTLISEMT